jgi:hypothetical protein
MAGPSGSGIGAQSPGYRKTGRDALISLSDKGGIVDRVDGIAIVGEGTYALLREA